MSGFGLLFVAALAVGLYFAYLAFKRPPGARRKRKDVPVPTSDVSLHLGEGEKKAIFGYVRATNTVSIWTPINDVVYVCGTRFSVAASPQMGLKSTGAYDQYSRVTVQTPYGPLNGDVRGPRVPGTEYEEATGRSFLALEATLETRSKLPPVKDDSRSLVKSEQTSDLFPAVKSANGLTTWTLNYLVSAMEKEVADNFERQIKQGTGAWRMDKVLQA